MLIAIDYDELSKVSKSFSDFSVLSKGVYNSSYRSTQTFRSNRPGYPHPVSSELENSGIRVAVGDCSVTERRRWRPPYQTGKTVHVHAKHYKHKQGRTHGAGCVRQWFRTAEPLGERRYENWNTHTHTHTHIRKHWRCLYVPLVPGNVKKQIVAVVRKHFWTDARRPVPRLWIRSTEIRGWGGGGDVVTRIGTLRKHSSVCVLIWIHSCAYFW